MSVEAVTPCLPVAGYVGGKKNLAKRIIARIEAIDHDLYAEPFVGMGGVFLRRSMRPRCEVINDRSEDIATFFRVLQHHYVAFMEMIRFQIASRAGFERLIRQNPTTLTDLQRSARFLYLQRMGFGGKVADRSFGLSTTQSARFDVTKLAPMLEALHERLAPVVVERLPWTTFIDRYDRVGALFYLDPPYYGTEHFYGEAMFDRSEFAAIAEQLGRLKGQFLLSINDRPEVRDLFGDFAIEAFATTYSMPEGNRHAARELLISKPTAR